MADYPRLAESRVRIALRDTRVVALTGPRQSGKTTLARKFARQGRIYLTLDDQATLEAARADPVAFIRGLDRAVIDEVQRVPAILLAIKRSVDEDQRPGRFLLTGSANLASIGVVRDSLAGRIETIPLYPLSRAETLRHKQVHFIASVFQGEVPPPAEKLGIDGLVPLVAQGGYPEALTRRTESRRRDWYRAYVDSIVERDLPEIAGTRGVRQMPRVLQMMAQFAGNLTNLTEIGRGTELDRKTVEHYVQVLEQLYLVRRLQPWSSNTLSRIVKTPKLHFLDSGLLTALRGHSIERLRHERGLLGPLLEGFVYSELLKLAAVADDPIAIYHYRDRDQREVDFVMENAQGQVVGLEVKSAATVTKKDFAGLETLAAATGQNFAQGVLAYDGELTLSFGDRLRAVPLPAIWA